MILWRAGQKDERAHFGACGANHVVVRAKTCNFPPRPTRSVSRGFQPNSHRRFSGHREYTIQKPRVIHLLFPSPRRIMGVVKEPVWSRIRLRQVLEVKSSDD